MTQRTPRGVVHRQQGAALPLLWLSILLAFTAGCATAHVPPRVIVEADEVVVRLEPVGNIAFSSDPMGYSHPVALTADQVKTLLASISARMKVGLLRSFLSTPGTPRLFDNADLDRLVPAIQEALASATPKEIVVFLQTRNLKGPFVEVTSSTYPCATRYSRSRYPTSGISCEPRRLMSARLID